MYSETGVIFFLTCKDNSACYKTQMTNEEFYRECARLLDCEHEGEPFKYYRRTRWNNRVPGQGRFAGHGIIRVFGDKVHVSLTNPQLWMIGSKEDVLKVLSETN